MKDNFSLFGYEIAEKIKTAEVTKSEVFSWFKQRVEKLDKPLNSFVSLFDSADISEQKSLFSGLPIAIKDNICIKGKKITCASKILSNHIAAYDATVISRLKTAGLAIIGTTNMDEFAFGSSTENSCYGLTKNPWNINCVAGGSSGGSTAAVAARLVPFALGSDTGGSIRQPASFCGVVGFKPTYGRVSRFGLVAFGSSLDQIGPITTNFIDSANLLNIICGFDPFDSTSVKTIDEDFTDSLIEDCKNIKIGVPKEYFQEGLSPVCREAISAVIETFKAKGAIIVDISLPYTSYAVATYYIVASSEASSNLQRFDGVKYGARCEASTVEDMYSLTRGNNFGSEAKRRIFLGTYSLSSGYYDAYYVRALKVRRLIKNDFDKAFREVDVILTPTAPSTAFRVGEKISDPLSMYLSDVYTISANLAGLPAVSFPCGFDKDNLPIGAQLIGKEFDEKSLIRLGYSYQQNTDFHKKIPKLFGAKV
ncbi:MAG: Asp-tRNA(Asn)/Glu-tRNA(Gln) amidotransferase subunit GatA [Candidatus Omnitrophica bacterium]|nr:Asp-tRNA(Asn)/Glu-tRNA(Gln) amidotransferase subunit GatA [Candidatus Omnitrophota bacterium]